MRRDLEFIVQPQLLLRLTFSLNGGSWSIPSGRFVDCRSCSLLARGAAWLADSNCDSPNPTAVTASLMLLSLTRCPDGFVALFIGSLLFFSLCSGKFLVETSWHTGKA